MKDLLELVVDIPKTILNDAISKDLVAVSSVARGVESIRDDKQHREGQIKKEKRRLFAQSHVRSTIFPPYRWTQTKNKQTQNDSHKKQERVKQGTYGTLDMDSMPPATMTSRAPVWRFCAASMTAFKPEAQTLLMVVASVVRGHPAPKAAWRAGD